MINRCLRTKWLGLGLLLVVLAITQTPAGAAPRRFVDNGDGTITDRQTGLMWQKQDDAGGQLTDKDIQRSWNFQNSGTEGSYDDIYSYFDGIGSSIFTWLDRLNGRLTATPSQLPFAGYTDWRIPTIYELQTLIDPAAPGCPGGSGPFTTPCIDPIFNTSCTVGCTVTSCSCTKVDFYWSSSTKADDQGDAWQGNFVYNTSPVTNSSKIALYPVRAVRGGR